MHPTSSLARPLLLVLALAACTRSPAPTRATGGNSAGNAAGDSAVVAGEAPADTLARIVSAPEGEARQPLYRELRRGPAEQVLPALRAAFGDSDPDLRTVAAAATARREDGSTLAPELLALATGDPEGRVRIAATRALAHLKVTEAFEPLRANLGHAVPETRLSALRALARIDATRAAGLSELGRLQLDPDARVSGAATKVSRGVSPM